jgi:YfiH family protein
MIELIEPKIFSDYRLISGVTLSSSKNYPVTGYTCGNDEYYGPELINFHRNELANQLGVGLNNLKFQKQVHGDTIRLIDSSSIEDESDAMITNQNGIVLCVKVADCAAILIHDPVINAIAAIHSGWKGTLLRITEKTINKLKSEYNSHPENLIAYISPCASGINYEVGEEFIKMFGGHVNRVEEKYYFDNTSAIQEQMINSGLKPSHIEVSGICSIGDLRCHSFRRDKEKAGRMTAFIGLI